MEQYVEYMLGDWWVVDTETPGAIVGPFKTEAEAWDYIQKAETGL